MDQDLVTVLEDIVQVFLQELAKDMDLDLVPGARLLMGQVGFPKATVQVSALVTQDMVQASPVMAPGLVPEVKAPVSPAAQVATDQVSLVVPGLDTLLGLAQDQVVPARGTVPASQPPLPQR